MQRHQSDATAAAGRFAAAPGEAAAVPRSFLFLQGPISNFFDRLGRTLIARGHRVHRINLHLGDQLFWRLPATQFRGRFEDWREFVAAALDRHQITDLVLHGDRRPYHIVAAEEARARGIRVLVTDLGYLRPDWVTLEYDGMTTYSRFPRDPAAIRALAAELPKPDLEPGFHTPFWLVAILDVAYNLGLVFGRLLYPHYRYHSIVHPFAEYAGWLWSRATKPFTARATIAEKRRLADNPGTYFLVPLQISTDFQIRAHSPFRDVREAVRHIIASFAASGSRRRLVFVVHPLDNGLIGWTRLVARLARQFGIAGQAFALHGGTPLDLLRGAAGVITVNSTVGVNALHQGVPVKTLGNAVFDIAGLTCQAPLDAFWHDPLPPDPGLMTAFLQALAGTTQVKGGYYERTSQARAIAGFVERLERGLYPLPPVAAADLASRAPRPAERTVVVAGISDRTGLALARAQAAPGVRLCLVGAVERTVDQAAADCRQRGAVVDTSWRGGGQPPAAGLTAPEIDPPVDTLIVHADPGAQPLVAAIDKQQFGGPLQLVADIVATMRRRGHGAIVLVSDLAGREAPSDAVGATRLATAFRGYAAELRRQLHRDGISAAVVVPRVAAWHAAARLRAPELTLVGADRLAAQIERARRRSVIVVPGVAVLTARTLRVVWRRVGDAARAMLPPGVAAIGEPVDEAPVPDESGAGD